MSNSGQGKEGQWGARFKGRAAPAGRKLSRVPDLPSLQLAPSPPSVCPCHAGPPMSHSCCSLAPALPFHARPCT